MPHVIPIRDVSDVSAAGMIAATAELAPREATARLRASAARSRQRLTDVADRLVRRRPAPEPILFDAP